MAKRDGGKYVIIFVSIWRSFNDFVGGWEKVAQDETMGMMLGRLAAQVWEGNMHALSLHSYTIDADRRVYCICDPALAGLGGGRWAGFRKVCRDMIILAMDTGT